MSAIPSSWADVFKDKALSLLDKRFLMQFFKLMTDYTKASYEEQQQQQFSADILEEDLNAPFLDFLRQCLPASIQSHRAVLTYSTEGHDGLLWMLLCFTASSMKATNLTHHFSSGTVDGWMDGIMEGTN
ncbi:unnamed protein product [Calypogeia fissa]